MMWQIRILGPGGIDPTTLDPNSFWFLALRVFSIAMVVLSGLAVLYIVIGGLNYITAAGNPAEQTNAKKTITYAVLGLGLALLSFAIVGEVLHRFQFVGSV